MTQKSKVHLKFPSLMRSEERFENGYNEPRMNGEGEDRARVCVKTVAPQTDHGWPVTRLPQLNDRHHEALPLKHSGSLRRTRQFTSTRKSRTIDSDNQHNIFNPEPVPYCSGGFKFSSVIRKLPTLRQSENYSSVSNKQPHIFSSSWLTRRSNRLVVHTDRHQLEDLSIQTSFNREDSSSCSSEAYVVRPAQLLPHYTHHSRRLTRAAAEPLENMKSSSQSPGIIDDNIENTNVSAESIHVPPNKDNLSLRLGPIPLNGSGTTV